MNFLKLLTVSLTVFLLFSCAEKKTQSLKEFYAEGVEDFIKKMQTYQSLESALTINYETKGNPLIGDASLKIYKTETLLRVYYLGFPLGEVYEKEGEVTSNLLIEPDKIKQIITGIRKGFMWWNGDFEITESEENFILKEKGTDREIFLTKNGFMPISQTFTVENQKILITYGEYKKIKTDDNTSLTMPSSIIVHYKNRTLKIKVNSINLIHG